VELPGELRTRLGWPPEHPCGTADGEPVLPAQLKIRIMNFGQHWRTEGIEDVDYTLVVPLAVLAEEMEREYPSFIEDSIAHPSDDPYERALRERGWPPVAVILDDPALLRLAVADWYALDVLGRWIGDAWAGEGPTAERPGFVLNTVDFQGREGDLLRFAGRARRAGVLDVRYQDV
jgi:hypothetical protein